MAFEWGKGSSGGLRKRIGLIGLAHRMASPTVHHDLEPIRGRQDRSRSGGDRAGGKPGPDVDAEEAENMGPGAAVEREPVQEALLDHLGGTALCV